MPDAESTDIIDDLKALADQLRRGRVAPSADDAMHILDPARAAIIALRAEADAMRRERDAMRERVPPVPNDESEAHLLSVLEILSYPGLFGMTLTDIARAIIAERDAARAEAGRLRTAIRAHRDERGDDRCHLDDTRLYAALGEGDADGYEVTLPPCVDFLRSCERYWRQRQTPGSEGKATLPGGMTIAQLTSEADAMRRERDAVIGLLVQESVVSVPAGLYDALLPDSFSPLGFSWTQDLSRDEAFAAVRAAAGLNTPDRD